MITNLLDPKSTDKRTLWVSQFLEAILAVFPSSIRPKQLFISSNQTVFIHRAIFMPISTHIFDCVSSIQESQLIRKLVYSYCNIEPSTYKPKKLMVLYLLREKPYRQVVNEDEFLNTLKNLSSIIQVTRLSFNNLTFSEQVLLMSKTDIIFGVHGAGFVNILFLLPKSGLIEFFVTKFYRPYYMNMCRKCNLLYDNVDKNPYRIESDSTMMRFIYSRLREANIYLRIDVAMKKIEMMIEKVWKWKYCV